MNSINEILIHPRQSAALAEIKKRIFQRFKVKALVLYGSAVRGQADEESDLDLLVVTSDPLTRFERHEITNIVFEVNLQYETNFSNLVVDQKSWESGPISVLPLRDEIMKNGIQV